MSGTIRAEFDTAELDPWYEEHLACPVDGTRLVRDGRFLCSAIGRRYPIVNGVPVLLRGDVEQTIAVAHTSLAMATDSAQSPGTPSSRLYVETLGISAHERTIALNLAEKGATFDPVVAVMMGATSGNTYRHLIGKDAEYPIPNLRFPTPKPGLLLDIGCNWGRWSIAAARAGHTVVGIDPQLGAVLAARRVCRELGVSARFIVGDARYLPFRSGLFDYIWCYSVLQHFDRPDVRRTLAEMMRVTVPGGLVRVQMANAWGIRNLMHMARRGFRAAQRFDVRYWRPGELCGAFADAFGSVRLEVDGFLGLGLQYSDYERMSPSGRVLLLTSEALRRLCRVVPGLARLADSLFCTAQVKELR